MSTTEPPYHDPKDDAGTSNSAYKGSVDHVEQSPAGLERTDSHLEDSHVQLGWRSWMVVFVTCFAYAM